MFNFFVEVRLTERYITGERLFNFLWIIASLFSSFRVMGEWRIRMKLWFLEEGVFFFLLHMFSFYFFNPCFDFVDILKDGQVGNVFSLVAYSFLLFLIFDAADSVKQFLGNHMIDLLYSSLSRFAVLLFQLLI